MNKGDFNDLVDEVLREARQVLEDKNPEYTNLSGDVLNNFKEAARLTESAPLKVWSAYFIKHVLSVLTYVRRSVESEPIEKRAIDLINFLCFFVALVREERRRE